MSKILIVDDEHKIREVIYEYLSIHNFESRQASNGLEAIQLVQKEDFDLIVMDIMMPVMDGYTAVKEIRKLKSIPIIMLSARDGEYDKLHGFDLGVDDYVVKPFSPKELIARIQVILKRSTDSKPLRYTFGTLKVDVSARDVYIDDKKINLTPKEFDLLVYFIEHQNIALRRDTLLEHVWNYNFYGDDRTVDTHVKMLRSNLGEHRELIKTVRGVGYKFEV